MKTTVIIVLLWLSVFQTLKLKEQDHQHQKEKESWLAKEDSLTSRIITLERYKEAARTHMSQCSFIGIHDIKKTTNGRWIELYSEVQNLERHYE